MLSGVAEAIYWMARSVERAENVARLVDVHLQLVLDAPPGEDQDWQSLVNALGDQNAFAKQYDVASQENVLQFLVSDDQNPNSIASCVQAARANARSVREVISSAMWLQLNKFYLMVEGDAARPMDVDCLTHFLHEVVLASHLFSGITDATMTRGTGWHFTQIGRMLERADQVSRILDMKYTVLLGSPEDGGTPFHHIQWGAVLRSAAAFEMYCKQHGRISPRGVIEFLVLGCEFPRSIRFCAEAARHALDAVAVGSTPYRFPRAPEKLMDQVCNHLATVTVDDITRKGLHEYVDQFQLDLNQVGQAIFERFFEIAVSPRSTQDQWVNCAGAANPLPRA